MVCLHHREKTRAMRAAERSRGPALPGMAGEQKRHEAGRKTPLLNLLGLPPRRGWPPKCGLRTNLRLLLCFPTCSRENAHKSEAQGKAVIN